MARKMWVHKCKGTKIGRGVEICPDCGKRGKYDGWHYTVIEFMGAYANCITVNVTMGSNVASGKMLLTDRQKSLSEEYHDEPEKQARVIRSCATTLPESEQA